MRMRIQHPDVTVVIPTRNEAKNLPHVARRMPDGIAEIIVVDGHSTDDTIDVARSLWPRARI
ncbi:MAG: glycosyltransferase, partial [Actinomycetota bacterium]|nr:glycosyltransferase [Actinomycetota bacterium]